MTGLADFAYELLAAVIILLATNLIVIYLLYQEKRRCTACQIDLTQQMRKIQVQSKDIEKLSKVVRAKSVAEEQQNAQRAELETAQELLMAKTREVAQRITQIKQEQAELQSTLQKTQETLQQKEKRIALQEELLTLQARQISLQAENVVQLLPYKMGKKGKASPNLRRARSASNSSATHADAPPSTENNISAASESNTSP
jgi:chromosome segregation ATPase